MIWSVVQQIGGQIATMLVFFALAALLPPSDFGLVGMAGAWLAVLNAFGETGFGAALIQREQLRSDHLSSIFGINLVVGVALTIVGVALSWPAAALFRTPALQPVMATLSLGFLIRSFGLTQAALAQRELRFRALAVRDLVASLGGGGLGIGLALAGYGVWSLVGMTLLNAVVGTALLWRLARWRPSRLEVSRRAAAELWPYGSQILGFNLLKAVAQNTDRFIIGSVLGVHAVGVYTFASRAVLFPVTTLVGAMGAYLFPRVSRVQGDRVAVRAVYRAVVIAVLNIVLPGLAVVVVLAPVFVPLLGADWAEAVPIMQLLTVAALAQALIAPVGQLMKGLGRPQWLVRWSIGFTAVTALALWFGSAGGLPGTALAYVLVHAAALPVILLLGWRLTGVGSGDLLQIAWRPGVATIVLALGLGFLSRFTAQWSGLALSATGVLIAVGYLAALTRLSPEFVGLARRELRKLTTVAGAARQG
jgi:O-antigen/teichoic acid export membrane protein